MQENSGNNEHISGDDAMEIIKSEIVGMVTQINATHYGVAREMMAIILHDIFCEYKSSLNYNETYELIRILYQLIFYNAIEKSNTTIAFHLLCGFIQFGHSNKGHLYKPMLDYLVIEAFDELLDRLGWCIVKPCILLMHNIFPRHATYEHLFLHIVEQIIRQLNYDINTGTYNSGLCNYLPREKSFEWGWFARYIACALFPKMNNKLITPKKMRMKLMNYRKLITKLRKNAQVQFVKASSADEKLEENWAGIVAVLANNDTYLWAKKIIHTAYPSTNEERTEGEWSIPVAIIPDEAEAEVEAVAEAEVAEAEAEAEAEVEAEVAGAEPEVAEAEVEAEVAGAEAAGAEPEAEVSKLEEITLEKNITLDEGSAPLPLWRSWLGWN